MFRKKTAYVPPAPELPLLGSVLLDAELSSTTGLISLLEGTLGVSIECDDDDVLQVPTPDGVAFISVVNRPLLDPALGEAASKNYFWEQAEEKVAAHRAHLLISVLGYPDEPVNRERILGHARTFTSVVAAALGLDSAIGVHIGAHELVHEAKPFREAALNAMQDDEVPVSLLVHLVAAPQPDQGATGFTRGLRVFGHDDLEIVDSSHSPQDIFELLMNVTHYLVTGETYLMPGESLGYTDEMRLPISFSPEARYFDSQALRIEY